MFSFKCNYSQLDLYHEGEVSSLPKQLALMPESKKMGKSRINIYIFSGKLSNLFKSTSVNTKSKQTFILQMLY